MIKNTPEYILKPSLIFNAGVGCFALAYVPAGERLVGDVVPFSTKQLLESEIPDSYLKYCVFLENGLYLAPSNFLAMSVFWYVNHSKTPNVEFMGNKLFAKHDINPGDELTLYYPDLLTHPKNATWVLPEHI